MEVEELRNRAPEYVVDGFYFIVAGDVGVLKDGMEKNGIEKGHRRPRAP